MIVILVIDTIYRAAENARNNNMGFFVCIACYSICETCKWCIDKQSPSLQQEIYWMDEGDWAIEISVVIFILQIGNQWTTAFAEIGKYLWRASQRGLWAPAVWVRVLVQFF